MLLRWGRSRLPEATALVLGCALSAGLPLELVAPRALFDAFAIFATIKILRSYFRGDVSAALDGPAGSVAFLFAFLLPPAVTGAAFGALSSFFMPGSVGGDLGGWAYAGATGSLVFGPAMMLVNRPPRELPRGRTISAVALAFSTVAYAVTVSWVSSPNLRLVPFFPLLAWAALQFSNRGSAAFTALVGTVYHLPTPGPPPTPAQAISLLAASIAAIIVGGIEKGRQVAIVEGRDLLEKEQNARREAEDARATVNRILNTITDPFLALDEDLRLIYANGSAVEARIATADGKLSDAFLDEIRDRQAAIHHNFAAALVRRTFVRFDWEPRESEAKYDVYASSAHGIVSAHFRDVTAERNAALQLAASERRYRELTEASFDLVAELDAELAPLELNHRWAEITGIPAEELVGTDRFRSLLTPSSLATLREAAAAPAPVSPQLGVELHVPDGSRRQLELTLRRVEGDSHVYVVARDVTERLRLAAQLAESQRLESVGRLAGGIAHDFNNLLLVIAGYADFLKRTTEGRTQADAEEIAASAEQGRVLVRRLLAFAGRQVMSVELVDLNSVVRSTEAMLQRLIDEDVELRTDFHLPAALVEADRGQIERILVNLALNARETMEDGGVIWMEVDEAQLSARRLPEWGHPAPGEYIALTVRDTGSGIPAHVRPNLFEPFFSTKSTATNSGLGLATVYGTVSQLGGGIDVTSEPGSGAAFTIYFPRAYGEIEEPEVTEQDVAPTSGAQLHGTVLVVEDEDGPRRFLGRALTELGCLTLTAASGAEALELVAASPDGIDVLVTDVVMPEMNGPELVRRFQRLQPLTPVIFMTGYSDRAIELRGRLGGVALLEKPFDRTELRDAVSDALTRARTRGGNDEHHAA